MNKLNKQKPSEICEGENSSLKKTFEKCLDGVDELSVSSIKINNKVAEEMEKLLNKKCYIENCDCLQVSCHPVDPQDCDCPDEPDPECACWEDKPKKKDPRIPISQNCICNDGDNCTCWQVKAQQQVESKDWREQIRGLLNSIADPHGDPTYFDIKSKPFIRLTNAIDEVIKQEKEKWKDNIRLGKICTNCGNEKDNPLGTGEFSEWCVDCLQTM